MKRAITIDLYPQHIADIILLESIVCGKPIKTMGDLGAERDQRQRLRNDFGLKSFDLTKSTERKLKRYRRLQNPV